MAKGGGEDEMEECECGKMRTSEALKGEDRRIGTGKFMIGWVWREERKEIRYQ